ncbi:MAG TPA: DUF6317 family protein [Streptosporangiaceae bacterium]|nr:DUF6317 family protein [Streptosporangiaceae bacterium]
MSGGFQVVVADLQQAASAFHAEAKTFAAIMPATCPALPDGGDAGFDGSLRSVVDAVCLLHLQIAGSIDNHGTRLQTAHDRYGRNEESLGRLCGQITDPATI